MNCANKKNIWLPNLFTCSTKSRFRLCYCGIKSNNSWLLSCRKYSQCVIALPKGLSVGYHVIESMSLCYRSCSHCVIVFCSTLCTIAVLAVANNVLVLYHDQENYLAKPLEISQNVGKFWGKAPTLAARVPTLTVLFTAAKRKTINNSCQSFLVTMTPWCHTQSMAVNMAVSVERRDHTESCTKTKLIVIQTLEVI